MGVGDELETRARTVRRLSKRRSSESIEDQVVREIAIVSERIDRIREARDAQYLELVREEFRLRRELKSLDSGVPLTFSYDAKTRDKMKRRLLDVGHHRRRHRNEGAREIESLHDRLLTLFKQHDLLGGV